VQKAKELFDFLERHAAAWSDDVAADKRARHFHGLPHPDKRSEGAWWPRIFILSQYSAQCKLIRALLEADPDVSGEVSSNFVVCCSAVKCSHVFVVF
jgi:hypothetical protein